jgi:hypothetical protein
MLIKPKVTNATTVVDTENLSIVEIHGAVASSGNSSLSACVVEVYGEAQENYSTPEYDTYIVVLEGTCEIIAQVWD